MKKVLCIFLCLICFIQGCAYISEDEVSDELENHQTTQSVSSESAADYTLKESVQEILKNDTASQESDTAESQQKAFDEGGYYYSQLSADEQTVYEQIYHSIVQRIEVKVSTLDADVVDKVFNCVTCDHPELFYIGGYKITTATRLDEIVSQTFLGEYIYDEAQVSSYEQQLEGAISAVLVSAPMQGTDYDKVKYVYETLIDNTKYVLGCRDNQNILSVFLYHESVCNGYAKATQILLNRLGVETTFITGTADGESHAWNLVKSDGAWYYLDTTWGDSDFKLTSQENLSEQLSIPRNYEYLLVDGVFLAKTHTLNKIVPLPDCVAKKDNYFVKEGLYLDSLDPENLRLIFDRAYEASSENVQLKCANRAVFDDVKRYLIEEEHIFDYLRDSKETTYYVDEDIYTLCFWLFN